MKVELITAIVAIVVSISSVFVNALQIRLQQRKNQAEKRQWEKEFQNKQNEWKRAVERGITQAIFQETSIKLYEARLEAYSPVWPLLKITAGYEWKRIGGAEWAKDSHQNAVVAVQQMADSLTALAYESLGLLMSEESRSHLTGLRRSCGAFNKNKLTFQELKRQAHWFKHSLRADLYIPTSSIENEEFRKYTGIVNQFLESKD
ncbi:hypothetical protein [Halomicronema sp. CCY15110]|uniref:hypothetical protein n=1 Tax=Halomicronema sp. CCY15110 TaxID=2767773 RepID=UPI00194FB62C|nr:hypothetical protein [Halomicronema sp. CCY15110]